MLTSVLDFLATNVELIKNILMIIFMAVLVFLCVLAFKYENRNSKNYKKIKKMTMISSLSALSIILYYFIKIPLGYFLPFIPSFLELHFSNVPIYIGGYLFGPVSGSIITIIRFLVKLPGSSTLGIGEIADLLIGLSTVLISSIMYHRNKTKKTALISSLSIIGIWLVFAILSNWLFVMPFYMHMFGFEAILGMLSVIPGVTASNYMGLYILYAVIPFNLILSSMVSLITFILYKRLSVIYRKL